MNSKQQIILLGYKHVGKSTVGKLLAAKLKLPFIDLDWEIEKNYQDQFNQTKSCREIYQQHGEACFREWETTALHQIIQMPKTVIALGGGTPLRKENQTLIKSHWLIHLSAPPAIIYTRIMTHGKPATFAGDQDPKEFFQQQFEQREKIYSSLADLTVDNSQSPEQTVAHIYNLRKTQ